MTQATRARLKPNAIISPIDRPLFDKASIMGRSRRIDTSAEVWQIGETEPVRLSWSALSRFPDVLVSEIKYAMEFFLEKLSPRTVANFFEILKRLCASIDEWEHACAFHASVKYFDDNNKPYWDLPILHFPCEPTTGIDLANA